jgi:hypothetical protein
MRCVFLKSNYFGRASYILDVVEKLSGNVNITSHQEWGNPQPQYRRVHVVYQGESFKAGTYMVHNLQDELPRSVSLHSLISANFLSGSKGWLVRSQMKAEKSLKL